MLFHYIQTLNLDKFTDSTKQNLKTNVYDLGYLGKITY